MNRTDNEPGEAPDISISGLTIWISGRQFDNAKDFWDANWLMITARCVAVGSEVIAQGPIIHLSEVAQWVTDLEALRRTVQGEIRLSCMEPELEMGITLDKTGSGSFFVSMTPDNVNQRHDFTFPVDQSYLPALIAELQAVLCKYPIKGDPE